MRAYSFLLWLVLQNFQFKETQVDADVLYEESKGYFIPKNANLYIATDERKKDFFKILKDHYNVYFLDDFKDLVRVCFLHFLWC